jgi:hypothetical protein
MTSSTEDLPYIMGWSIPGRTRYSLKVTDGTAFPNQKLSPPKEGWINAGSPYGWVLFGDSLKVEIYPASIYGKVLGNKVNSMTITISTPKNKNPTGYEPQDDKGILKFTYEKTTDPDDPKNEKPAPPKKGWHSKHWYRVEAPTLPIPREPPPIISNKDWYSGQNNSLTEPVANNDFWVADYGADKWSAVTPGNKLGGIQQSTAGTPDPNDATKKYFGSRAYPIRIVTGATEWKVCQGNELDLHNGVAYDGLWQIAIKIGSNGRPQYVDPNGEKHGWCETFYLAERFPSLLVPHDLCWGDGYYSDGQGGVAGTTKAERLEQLKHYMVPWTDDRAHDVGPGSYSREIDIMETMWQSEGPQINLGNWYGGTGWNYDAGKPNYGLTTPPKWSDVHPYKPFPSEAPLTTDFIIFGCLIRTQISTFYGTGSGTNLTVTVIDGALHPGDTVTGTGIPADTTIVSQTSGTTGGDGVYVTNNSTNAALNIYQPGVAAGSNLWLYAYKGPSEPKEKKAFRNNQWYCTPAIPRTNRVYKQVHPFVPYIGTWTDIKNPTDTGKWWTKYNHFIYLKQDDPKIKGKDPFNNYNFFGWKLVV